ncbi:MAG: hypothetical protein AB8G96_07430 [Phycisphaerales bacterium]
MGRIHFESVGQIDPDDDATEIARRQAVPLVPVMIIGAIIAVLAAGAGYVQSRVFGQVPLEALGDVQQRAAGQHKHVAMFFSSADCVPCTRMRTESLADPGIKAILDRRFILYEIDVHARGSETVTAAYEIDGELPAFVLAASTGHVLIDLDGEPMRADGYLDTVALQDLLTREVGAKRSRYTPDGGPTPTRAGEGRRIGQND